MTSRRPLPVSVIVAAIVLTGALVGCSPAGETVSWNLAGMGGANSAVDQHHPFDATRAEDMTSFEVHVERWPVEPFSDASWLTQSIEYGSDAVTLTLRVSDAYRARIAGQTTIGWYDTGGWVPIELREPLRSRSLVDGATGTVVRYPSAH